MSSGYPPPRRRRISPWLVAFVVVMINLPLANTVLLSWRLDSSGVDVVADVTAAAAEPDGSGAVQFRYGPDVDPGQRAGVFGARLDAEAYRRATSSGVVQVRVLPDRLSAYDVEGEQSGHVGTLVTLVVDLVLLALGVQWWRRRGRHAPEPVPVLHLVALEDVAPGGADPVLEPLDDTTYVVSGEVALVDEVGIVLDLGDRRVRVDLAGHENPVGHREPARVTARLSDWGS